MWGPEDNLQELILFNMWVLEILGLGSKCLNLLSLLDYFPQSLVLPISRF